MSVYLIKNEEKLLLISDYPKSSWKKLESNINLTQGTYNLFILIEDKAETPIELIFDEVILIKHNEPPFSPPPQQSTLTDSPPFEPGTRTSSEKNETSSEKNESIIAETPNTNLTQIDSEEKPYQGY